jgi:hypothetical protein
MREEGIPPPIFIVRLLRSAVLDSFSDLSLGPLCEEAHSRSARIPVSQTGRERERERGREGERQGGKD